jgi:L-iditol 2-dehydrogenase
MTVGIFGCGPIGLLAVQLARVMGATETYATDVLPHRLEAARALGATEALDATGGDEWQGILDRTGGRGVDVALEFAGVDAAVHSAMAAVRPGARVLLGGIPDDDRTAFQASLARRKGLTLMLVRRMKRVYPRAIALVERGLIDMASLVTDAFPLSEAGHAFEALSDRRGVKVIVEP